jgi:hypothetical protein
MDNLNFGIPGVDVPYPKYVQDALDFIERETNRVERFERFRLRRAEESRRRNEVERIERQNDEKFWMVRRQQQDAQRKLRPFQPPQITEVSVYDTLEAQIGRGY